MIEVIFILYLVLSLFVGCAALVKAKENRKSNEYALDSVISIEKLNKLKDERLAELTARIEAIEEVYSPKILNMYNTKSNKDLTAEQVIHKFRENAEFLERHL